MEVGATGTAAAMGELVGVTTGALVGDTVGDTKVGDEVGCGVSNAATSNTTKTPDLSTRYRTFPESAISKPASIDSALQSASLSQDHDQFSLPSSCSNWRTIPEAASAKYTFESWKTGVA